MKLTLARKSHRRPGLSLLEVLVALAIFLLSLSAISQLIRVSGDHALEVRLQAEATQKCQAKLAEVVAGAVPLTGGEGAFDEDPEWQWSVEALQGSAPNLWNISVRVSRSLPDGSLAEVTLNQWVVDPAMRGTTLDTVAVASSGATDAGATNPSSGSTGNPSSQPSAGGSSPSSQGPYGGSGVRPSGPGGSGRPPSGGPGGPSIGGPGGSGRPPSGGSGGPPPGGSGRPPGGGGPGGPPSGGGGTPQRGSGQSLPGSAPSGPPLPIGPGPGRGR